MRLFQAFNTHREDFKTGRWNTAKARPGKVRKNKEKYQRKQQSFPGAEHPSSIGRSQAFTVPVAGGGKLPTAPRPQEAEQQPRRSLSGRGGAGQAFADWCLDCTGGSAHC